MISLSIFSYKFFLMEGGVGQPNDSKSVLVIEKLNRKEADNLQFEKASKFFWGAF